MTDVTEKEIRETVIRLLKALAPETEPSELDPEENLRQALDIDSFDALNFVTALHDELDVEIPEADYGELLSLSRIVRYFVGAARARDGRLSRLTPR